MKHLREVNKSSDKMPYQHHFFDASLVKKLVKGKRVLDIGCWSGQFLSIIEKDSQTFGIDPGKSAINFAAKNRKGKYKVGSALKLPFKSSFFDIVTMWDVIEHLPKHSEEKALGEVSRVLKKGGYFAMSTVTTHPISVIFDPAFYLIGHRHYSEKYLTKLFENNNLKVKRVVYAGGVWCVIHDNLHLFFKHVLKRELNSKYIDEKVKSEYQGEGYTQIHIISQKI